MKAKLDISVISKQHGNLQSSTINNQQLKIRKSFVKVLSLSIK